jgi:dATP pyrophosphohydrolase
MQVSDFKIPESVLVVIYTVQGDVLLLERADHPGFWQSVTGSKDRLEDSFEATAVREVVEETGLQIGADVGVLEDWDMTNVYDIYPHWRYRYAPGIATNRERVFGLRLKTVMPVRLSPREHIQFAWLSVQEAAARCFSPSNAQAVSTLLQRL